MATLESKHAPATTSHARLRIQLGDVRKQIGPDRLDDILPLARALGSPDIERGVREEIGRLRAYGLGEAISELIELAKAIAPAGHRFEPLGLPGALMLFHVAGLTHLDPRGCLFSSDAWLPAPDPVRPPAPWALPRSPTRHIGASVSMAPADLLSFLRLRGYSLRTERLSYEKADGSTLCFDRVTARQYPSTPDHQALTVIVSTGIFARLAAAITPEGSMACLRDTQTFHLLAAGDTDFIGPLRFAAMKKLLRQRKPQSLDELADLLTEGGDAGYQPGHGEPPVYLEDLMRRFQGALGLDADDARTLCESSGRGDFVNQHKAWLLERGASFGMTAGRADTLMALLGGLAKRKALPNRATVFPLAHACLRAAYLKAHYPEAFWAIVAAG